MKVIEFYCDHCNLRIKAEAMMMKLLIRCPHCRGPVVVPMKSQKPRTKPAPGRLTGLDEFDFEKVSPKVKVHLVARSGSTFKFWLAVRE